MTWLMDHVYGRLPDFTLDDGSGAHYVNADVSYAWTAWQARAALAQPSPAPELERPEVAEVAFVLRNIGAMDAEDIDGDNVDLRFEDAEGRDTGCDVSIVEYAEKAADLFEQHDRIVGALRAENAKLSEALDRWPLIRDSLKLRLADALARVAELEKKLGDSEKRGSELAASYCDGVVGDEYGHAYCRYKSERDAALAEIAEMERQEPVAAVSGETFSSDGTSDIITRNLPIGTKLYANPVAQAGQMPQAWLDVQAERRRQITAEGWTPEHDDGHACDEIAAFACYYAMPPAVREWDASSTGYGDTLGEAVLPEGWEPKTGDRRRELIKACALALAEIERLDRAAHGKEVGHE
ncbi:TPA: hypothetical protein NIJ77_004733 [Pseudomonas aeruginosa]|nr:hypothetical protein [Pseudomonas aeruginosa]